MKISQDNPVKVDWMSTSAPPQIATSGNDAALNVPAVSKSRNFGDPAGKMGQHTYARMSTLSFNSNGTARKPVNFGNFGHQMGFSQRP